MDLETLLFSNRHAFPDPALFTIPRYGHDEHRSGVGRDGTRPHGKKDTGSGFVPLVRLCSRVLTHGTFSQVSGQNNTPSKHIKRRSMGGKEENMEGKVRTGEGGERFHDLPLTFMWTSELSKLIVDTF
jgi:hypothetical protein